MLVVRVTSRPGLLIAIGFVLVLFGVAVPFLMVIGILEASFWLGFLSFAASVGGLYLGIIGASFFIQIHKD